MSVAATQTEQIQSVATATEEPKFTIGAELKGFPVQVEFHGKAEALDKIINRLLALGATPPFARKVATTAATDAVSDGPPLCSKHGTPMKTSQHKGWFCTKKDGETYCKATVK